MHINENMKTNIKWLVFFAVLCILCTAAYILRGYVSGGNFAEIRLDGRLVNSVDLSKVDEPYEFRVDTGDGGYNAIRVEKGKIAVTDADCPDKICVMRGYISGGDLPIVCLPHKLSVTVKKPENPAPDAVSGRKY